MKYTILENGDLLITADPDNIELNQPWEDTLESVLCNGLHSVPPEYIGALTDAPILTDCCPDYENECILDESCAFWWYPDYMIKDITEELKQHGKIIFTKSS